MGFVITVVTLVATYLQARRARSSADQARDAAKAAAESATKQVAKSSLIGEVNAAIELARAISRIHNSENQGELLERYDDLIFRFQTLLAEVEMLQVDEVVGLKVGLDRLRTVKAGLLNGEPFGMGYLDDTVKDRVTELLIVRARLQREYDY